MPILDLGTVLPSTHKYNHQYILLIVANLSTYDRLECKTNREDRTV